VNIRVVLKIGLTLWLCSHPKGFAQRDPIEVWSEGTIQADEPAGHLSMFARAYARTGSEIQPFLQIGQWSLLRPGVTTDWYASSGLHWDLHPFRLFGEYRHHSQWERPSPSEWRVLLVFGEWFEKRVTPRAPTSFFFEPYSEALWSRMGISQLNLQVNPRSGMRYRWTSNITTDLFLDPALNLIQGNISDQNVEWRTSARLQLCQAKICLALIASRSQNFRMLASLGGTL